MERLEKVEELLKKTCYVIDILPERVPEHGGGQYFEVEAHLLGVPGIYEKFTGVLLKLMCYYHVMIFKEKWHDRPEPAKVVRMVNEIAKSDCEVMYVLLPDDEALMTLESGSLNISVYDPGDDMRRIMESVAKSEGLFWWKGHDQ